MEDTNTLRLEVERLRRCLADMAGQRDALISAAPVDVVIPDPVEVVREVRVEVPVEVVREVRVIEHVPGPVVYSDNPAHLETIRRLQGVIRSHADSAEVV